MRSRLFVAISVGILAVTQADLAQAQVLNRLNKALEQMNSSLASANQALAGGATPASTSSPAARGQGLVGLARIAPEQRSAITQRLAQTQQNQDLQESISEATATIQPFLERASCIMTVNGSSLNIFAAPGKNFGTYFGPNLSTQYHDRSICMDVVRLQGWSKPARNALKFEAVFEAADSGESTKGNYLLIRQSDGVWLFREG